LDPTRQVPGAVLDLCTGTSRFPADGLEFT
jgi:hypothetical protein